MLYLVLKSLCTQCSLILNQNPNNVLWPKRNFPVLLIHYLLPLISNILLKLWRVLWHLLLHISFLVSFIIHVFRTFVRMRNVPLHVYIHPLYASVCVCVYECEKGGKSSERHRHHPGWKKQSRCNRYIWLVTFDVNFGFTCIESVLTVVQYYSSVVRCWCFVSVGWVCNQQHSTWLILIYTVSLIFWFATRNDWFVSSEKSYIAD